MPKCHKFTNQLTAKPNNAIHQFTKTVGQSSPGDGRRWKGDTFRTLGHWGLKHGCPMANVLLKINQFCTSASQWAEVGAIPVPENMLSEMI